MRKKDTFIAYSYLLVCSNVDLDWQTIIFLFRAKEAYCSYIIISTHITISFTLFTCELGWSKKQVHFEFSEHISIPLQVKSCLSKLLLQNVVVVVVAAVVVV